MSIGYISDRIGGLGVKGSQVNISNSCSRCTDKLAPRIGQYTELFMLSLKCLPSHLIITSSRLASDGTGILFS
jgi:hypothetical protein